MQYGIELPNKLTYQIKWELERALTRVENEMIQKEGMLARPMEIQTTTTHRTIKNSKKMVVEVNITNIKQQLMELK